MGQIEDRIDVVSSRVAALIDGFPRWLDSFDRELPFARSGQQDGHVATLTRWQELGGHVSALIRDDRYVTSLYRTLQAWGIGRRGSRLVPIEEFRACLLESEPRLMTLQGVRVSDDVVAEPAFMANLWHLITGLGIVENSTFMVPGTKTLHHLLPMLVVPIDRLYMGTFFEWSPARMQTRQPELFREAFSAFSTIARAVDLRALTGPAWRIGEAKLIDNAIIGYCRTEDLITSEVPKIPTARPRASRSSSGKYAPLRDTLAMRAGSFEMSLDEIDQVVGGLPPSAWTYREWWANHEGNPQGAVWIGAGKAVDRVDLVRGRVRFRSV